MPDFAGGRRRVYSLLALLLAVTLAPCLASAQTTIVNDPTTVSFTPSPDHSAVMSDGRPVVDHYNLDIYSVGAGSPFQSTNIGKPSPAADGFIYYDFSAAAAAWTLPGGTYEARVVAVGPAGSGASTPSNAFTFTRSCSYSLSGTSASPPAGGGGTQVTVTTTSGCSWTAASNVAWVTVGPTAGTGTGTVIANVAANTSTSPRTGTITVAGQAFTISQAGTAIAAPAAPATPSPTAGATSVSPTPTVTWTACAGATSYSVAFGTANPPAQATTGLTTTSYVPGTLAAGTTYYWRVTATNSGGSTTGTVWSFTTAAAAPPPSSTVPAPWTSQDIGTVGLAGSASVSGTTFTVIGSGADIWGSADGFRYVHQPIAGNVEIVARVLGEQNTNQYAKAGIMLRASTSPSSAHVILDLLPSGGIEFMTRASTGATTTHIAGATQAPPAWLKLVRIGNTVSAAVSADGATWRNVGSTTVSMSQNTIGGLAVTSHNTTLRNTATFDNVRVTPLGATGLPSGWSNRDIGTVGLSGSSTYAAGRFTVTGAGADIWGTADSFQYMYRALSGDGQIVARVTSEQNTNTYAKAGVMVRAGLNPSDPFVILDLLPSGTIEFMTRASSGGTTTHLGSATQPVPCWLRLVRTGATITASVSADGVTWRSVGSTTVGFGASAYIGLAVTSHNTTLRNIANFDNVSVR